MSKSLSSGVTSISRPSLVHELFSAAAADYADAAAIQIGDLCLSYAAVHAASKELGKRIRLAGAQPADRVVIFSDDRVVLVEAIIAAGMASVAFVVVSPQLPKLRILDIIDDADPVLIVCDSESRDLFDLPFRGGRPISVIEARVVQVSDAESPVVAAASPTHPSDPAYIFYTSGSTGKPKGIAGRAKAIAHYIDWETGALNMHRPRVSQLIPPMFDAILRDIFFPLCGGGTVCIPGQVETVLDGRALALWLERERIEVVHCVPSLIRSILDQVPEGVRFESLRYVLLSGESLYPDDVRRWIARFGAECQLVNLYGPSETTMTKFAYFVSESDITRSSIPIGKPIRGAQAILLDAHLRACAPGIAGEIYIRTPYRALGYWRNTELTNQVFIVNPFTGDHDDLIYRTGDIGRVLEDGNFEFIGRHDDQVKIHGVRIELGDVESAIRSTGLVKEAVVALFETNSGERSLCAYVVGHGTGVQIERLREQLSSLLPQHMRPAAFMELEELPLTITGKVDRKRLPKPLIESEVAVASENLVEELVAGIWADVLKTRHVGLSANFFELGGHSLLIMQMLSRIREALHVDLPLKTVFENPTVGALAKEVERSLREGVNDRVPRFSKAERKARMPASYAQSRLWFIEQLEPGHATYNVPAVFGLSGRLDILVLERAVKEIVRRHEVLRTRFEIDNGEPVQVVEKEMNVGPWVVDLSGLDVQQKKRIAQVLSDLEAAHVFDLSRGPLLRLVVMRLTEEEHVLSATMHHIVTDGWSHGILKKEFGDLYSAYLKGEVAKLEDLKIQYVDYAVWQRDWLKGEVLAEQLRYWRKQLESLPLSELPPDYIRPPVGSRQGAVLPMWLDAAATLKLKELSQREGVTLFMTLLAGFQVVLGRWAGQADVAVGTDIANRNWKETEGLIGFFVNELVLRTDLGGSPSFRELLMRVREVTLGAYRNQDVPFERVVEELQPERSLNRSPLFQVKLVLQNMPREEVRLDGLRAASGPAAKHGHARFDMTVVLYETQDGIAGLVEYATDLYRVESLKRWIGHYQRVLEQVVEDVDKCIDDLELLTVPERKQVLEEWNHPEDRRPPTRGIQEIFEEQAALTPDTLAIVAGGEQVTYCELNARANQLAWYLRRMGAGLETRVAVCLMRGADVVIACLGVLKSGAVYVPLDPNYPEERLSYMVDDVEAPIMVTQQKLAATIPFASGQVVTLDHDWEEIGCESRLNPESLTEHENLAYVIYTSGSTGKPKGALISHGALASSQWARTRHYETPVQAYLLASPIAFDTSVAGLFWCLMQGGTLYITETGASKDPDTIVEQIRLQNITDFMMVSTQYKSILMRGGPADFDSLERVVIGGEVSSWQLVEEHYRKCARARLSNEYGPTEASVWSTVHDCAPSAFSATLPLGRPIANRTAYVLDNRMSPLPAGITGELYVGGAGIGRGYCKRAALTAECFVPDPFGEAGSRLYRTGDRARWLENGELAFVGRTDDQVKMRGYRIELGEIEAALTDLEGVRQAVAVVREEAHGKRLVAYVVSSVGGEELRSRLTKRLPDYMMPSDIIELDELPLAANSKVDRLHLQKMHLSGSAAKKEKAAPRDTTETYVKHVWEQVLGRSDIGIEDDFFTSGGNSLDLVALASRLSAAYGRSVPLRAIYAAPSIDQMSRYLRQEIALSIPSMVVPIQTQGEKLPFFCVHPASGLIHWYLSLARELGTDQPFYGIQSYGLEEGQRPLTTIEAMASKYIEDMRAIQPSGPYQVGGWSLGALVAFEIACQLKAASEDVLLVALMDGSLSKAPKTIAAAEWEVQLAEEIDRLIENLLAKDVNSAESAMETGESEQRILLYLENQKSANKMPPDITPAQFKRFARVNGTNILAARTYRPKLYPGGLTLFRTKATEPESESTYGWQAYARDGVDVHEISASHEGFVFYPHVATLAAKLRECLSAQRTSQ